MSGHDALSQSAASQSSHSAQNAQRSDGGLHMTHPIDKGPRRSGGDKASPTISLVEPLLTGAAVRTESPRRQKAHDLEKTTFMRPTWCDMCGGVLFGRGYHCKGDCKMKCHRGLGDGTENCRLDLLVTACDQGATRKEGHYKTGDFTKQIARNIHQKVKDEVVKATIQEQRDLGKFDKLKKKVDAIRSQCEFGRALKISLLLVVGSAFVCALFVFLLVWPYAWFQLGADKATNISKFQAVSSSASLLILELLLVLAVRIIAGQVLSYSDLLSTLLQDVLLVDLREDLDIDLGRACEELQHLTNFVLVGISIIFIIVVDLWTKALQDA